MNVKLSVLPTLTKKQKKLREKENGWVLDCSSEEKVKLKPYNFAAEKFVKHFVIRIPKKKKAKEELINSAKFRTFLRNEKCKILKIQNSLSAVSSK
jgi:RecA-family ATPase